MTAVFDDVSTSPPALDHIHGDLSALRRRRAVAVGAIAILSVAVVIVFAARAGGTEAPAHGAGPTLVMSLFAVAAVAGASLAIGFPLWTRTLAVVLTLLAASSALAGVALGVDSSAPWKLAWGLPCLGHGSMTTGIALVVAAAVTGRLWRRMQDVSWGVALGMGTMGLAMLSVGCGASDPVHVLGFHAPVLLVSLGLTRALLKARKV